ncbi:hypothetical protein BDR04DRAFT_1232257 [Suillus decipiens]|nr:hypothetical protein BDR04DRAFT_1232257 [Suillus decipiens]
MRLLVLFCIFLYLLAIGIVQAASATDITNTTTSDSVKFKTHHSRPELYGPSSSVLTLFACIYSAIHPNIPSPKDSPLRILWRRLGIMTMALIAPELIVTWAMRQWFSARRVTKECKESGCFKISRPHGRPENHGSIEACAENHVEGELDILFCTPITLAHDLSASQDHDSTRLLIAHLEASIPRSSRPLAKPFKKVFKAYVLEQYEDAQLLCADGRLHALCGRGILPYTKSYLTLRPDYILKLIHDGCIDVPTLTAKQIHDRSKGNAISKGLIMVQVAWFIMQLITRAIYHLETTQLETGTLAFAVLNFLTYAVWWNKPLNVQCSHLVYWKSTGTKPKDHIDDVDESGEFAWLGILALVVGPIVELIGSRVTPTSRRLRVPTLDGSIKRTHFDKRVLQLAALLMATIFGGIHYNTYIAEAAQTQTQPKSEFLDQAHVVNLNVARMCRNVGLFSRPQEHAMECRLTCPCALTALHS